MPTPTPIPGTAPASAINDSVLRLGTRTSLASTMRVIFNPSGANAKKAIDTVIEKQLSAIGGGPCDAYRTDATQTSIDGGDNREYANPDCDMSRYGANDLTGRSNGGLSQLPNIPPPSSPRFAVMIRACQMIVADDNAVLNAVKFFYPSVTAATVAAPTLTDINSMFGLFYTGETAPAGVTNALATVSSSAITSSTKAIDGWRFVLLTLCESPGWQIQ